MGIYIIIIIVIAFTGFILYHRLKKNLDDKIYYPNGKIKIEENYRDGKRVRYALYNDDGSLRVEMFYKDNKKHGDYKSFQSNGKVRRHYIAKEGKQEGFDKTYYSNGNLEDEVNYINDKRDGLYKAYYYNGVLRQEVNYVNDKRDGVYKAYYENKNLESEGNYKDGKQDGLWKYYNEEGLLNNEDSYKNGRKIGEEFTPPKPKPKLRPNTTDVFLYEEIFKDTINLFINEMKKMPDWYQIIQARGNGHEMGKSMGIKVDDYEYWANAHKEEYILKYNEGNLDVEGINLRIEKFGFIVAELEKVIKKAAELNLNITHEMHNDYCAARASVLGAEYALKEMTK